MPAGGLRAGKGLQRCWLCRGTQEAVALLLNWGQWLGWDRMVRKKQPAERRGPLERSHLAARVTQGHWLGGV